MVRREPPDFGLWREVSPARLLMPVDTHVENMSRAIGLTRRRSRNWKMAEEITARLASIDPADPVKYDFALCHKRMSGDCLDRRDAVVCAPCGFHAVCRHWRGRRARAGAEKTETTSGANRRRASEQPRGATAGAATTIFLSPPTANPHKALRYK
jgi:hypothetical protein